MADSVLFFKAFGSKAVDTGITSVMFSTKSNDGCVVTFPSITTNVVDFARGWSKFEKKAEDTAKIRDFTIMLSCH